MLEINTILRFGAINMQLGEKYESHTGIDADLPIIFHFDYLNSSDKFIMHWHENIELLYFVSGTAQLTCDTDTFRVTKGELAVINPYTLHSIDAVTPRCEYYCLIVDLNFCNQSGLPIGMSRIKSHILEPATGKIFKEIIAEFEAESQYYKTVVKAQIIQLLAYLLRKYSISSENNTKSNIRQLEMVRKAMSYIAMHYDQPLTVEEISRAVGYSKYYFCRFFKEITGRTVVVYINELRCDRARQLICSGECNISESAERCGFHNLSYFTRIYKQLFGILPSYAKRDAYEKSLQIKQYVNTCVIRQ